MTGKQRYQQYLQSESYQQIRRQVLARAAGTCELCESRSVTEVHHIRYPKNNQTDSSDNLLALCHRCHCKLHGVKK